VRLRTYLVAASALVALAPAVLATPAAAKSEAATGTSSGRVPPGGRSFDPSALTAPPALPERDKAIAERVARGKAAWDSMTHTEREGVLSDVQSKMTPEVEAAVAQRLSRPQSASTLDNLSLGELATLAEGTNPTLANRLATDGVSVVTPSGRSAQREEIHTARDQLRADRAAAAATAGGVTAMLGPDDDLDGLPADFEATIADQFTPGYIPSLTEDPGTGFAEFKDQTPQEVLQVFDSIPPRQHYRVKPLGFTSSGAQQYSWLRVDYLTLWNRDDGLASLLSSGCLGNDMLDLFIGLIGLRNTLSKLLRGHQLDNERSIILAYAPTSGSQVNLDPAAYTARILYTAAHEEEAVFDNSYLVLINNPPWYHPILTETLQKHATYPFYPINGYPLLPIWVLASAYALIDTLEFFGLISPWTADFLFYLADTAYYGCIVERHYEIGLYWYPATAVNVGEPDRPAPGYRYINDPKLQRKFEYPFFTTSAPPPDQRIASVAVDSTAYQVGQAPTYTVTGTPNSPIYWSSTRNDVSTGEVDAFYGHYTDGNGLWSGGGAAWGAADVGTWTKSVRVGTQSATVSFTVYQLQPTVKTLVAVNIGKCLDSSLSTNDGVNPYMWTCVPTANNHQWLLEPLGQNTYTVRSLQTGKCLDSSLSTTDGVNPYMWTCSPTAGNHQWRFEPVGNNTFAMRSVHSGKCLDSGTSTADGTLPYMSTCGSPTTVFAYEIPGAGAPDADAPIAVSDANADGRADIAVTGPPGWSSLPVAFSNGDGTFTVTNHAINNVTQWTATPGAKIIGKPLTPVS